MQGLAIIDIIGISGLASFKIDIASLWLVLES